MPPARYWNLDSSSPSTAAATSSIGSTAVRASADVHTAHRPELSRARRGIGPSRPQTGDRDERTRAALPYQCHSGSTTQRRCRFVIV